MKRRGSVTIFMILSLVFTMSLFFTMSEVVRYFCLKNTAGLLASSTAQSGMGDYNRLLYEKYGILAVDLGYGRATEDQGRFINRMMAYGSAGGSPTKGGGIFTHVNLWQLDPIGPVLSDTVLLTDHDGAAFKKEGSIQQAYDIPGDVLDMWQDAGQRAGASESSGALSGETALNVTENSVYTVAKEKAKPKGGKSKPKSKDKSKDSKKSKDKDKKKTAAASDSTEVSAEDVEVDAIDSVKEFKKKGVLAQVLDDGVSVSGKRMDTAGVPSRRVLNAGTGAKVSVSALDEVSYRLFLLERFGSFLDKKDREGLDYEVEYVICGKDSDEENLRSVVKRLLLLREVENMAALTKDSTRRHEAEALAASVSAAVMAPELEPVLTAAIMAAWAYVESVLDVRLLLSGGKIGLIKRPADWTSELATLPEYLDTSVMAKPVANGIDYKGCLYALMCITGSHDLGLRPMDLMEAELHKNEDYVNVKIDNMLVEAKLDVTMTGVPVFFSMAPLIAPSMTEYEFFEERWLSYL